MALRRQGAIVTSTFCTDNLLFLFLALGNMHRPEGIKQAKELAKVAKAREQKECVGASVVMISSAFEPHESEAKCPINIWRDFKTYLSEIGLLLATRNYLHLFIYILVNRWLEGKKSKKKIYNFILNEMR